MKQYIVGIMASLITSCAIANPFAGAYVAGALGGISTNFQIRGSSNINVAGVGDVYTMPNNANVYANSILGTIGLGYAHPVAYAHRDFIVGIEADANFFNVSRTQTTSFTEIAGILYVNSSIKAQLKNSYDIVFRPGWLMDASTLLYGLLGASFGKFEVSQSANFTETAGLITISRTAGSSRSVRGTGLILGVGVQQQFWKRVSAALEYSYTDYGNLSIANNASTRILNVPVLTLNSDLTKVKVFTNAVSLKVFYNFL